MARERIYFEIYPSRCVREYGVAPCTAVLGVTGDDYCFKSPRTCQDPTNFLGGFGPVIRFAEPADGVHTEQFVPINEATLVSLSVRPQELRPGESLGTRESGTAVIRDTRHSGFGIDPYAGQRPYSAWNRATLNAKFMAIWPNLQGSPCAVRRVVAGKQLEDSLIDWYVIESVSGPSADGALTFTFKDALKLVENTSAVFPPASNGVLISGVGATTGATIQLTPAGVGDEYPTSFYASIGDENVHCTKVVGDTFTLDQRGLKGSTAKAHDTGDVLQLSKVYAAASGEDVLYDLLLAAQVPVFYLDKTLWAPEFDAAGAYVYSAEFAKPVDVKVLLPEFILTAGLTVWTDLSNRKVRIRTMRNSQPTASLTDNDFIQGSFSSTPLEGKRVSIALTNYAPINPSDTTLSSKNFAGAVVTPAQDPIAALENLPVVTRKIFTRWIPAGGGIIAEGNNNRLLARYTNPPRSINFVLPRDYLPVVPLGGMVEVTHKRLTDAHGLPVTVSAQVVSVDKNPATISVMCEEVRYAQTTVTGEHVILIAEETLGQFSVKALNDRLYEPAVSGDTVRVVIAAVVGSTNTVNYTLVQDYLPGSGVTVIIEWAPGGRLSAPGGDGGSRDAFGSSKDPGNGGNCLQLLGPTTLINPVIWSGGGGGGANNTSVGASWGGGGAGKLGGRSAFARAGETGSMPGVGLGFGSTAGASGGAPGLDGSNGTAQVGGSRGVAIAGFGYATITGTSDVRGSTI